MIVWLTGLPCSGKTTLGRALELRLHQEGKRAQLLDGDEVREQLWPELKFSASDRKHNALRFAYLAHLLSIQDICAIVSTVSPYRSSRDMARQYRPDFIEVYVNAPASVCEMRDVKGMYRKAHLGEIQHFTGVSDPYEPPLLPEVECRTDLETVTQSTEKILAAVYAKLKTRKDPQ